MQISLSDYKTGFLIVDEMSGLRLQELRSIL